MVEEVKEYFLFVLFVNLWYGLYDGINNQLFNGIVII